MLPVIVTPDAETWATGWIRAALAARTEPYAAGMYVSTSVPDLRRDRMVIVRRDGGPRVDLLHTAARLGVNVWATTDIECRDLTALVEGLFLSVRATDPVESVSSVAGPSPIPDAQPRRFFTVELLMRGTLA